MCVLLQLFMYIATVQCQRAGHKRASDPRELEFQAIVSCLT